MCKVLILLFIIITFIKNPENAPNLLALDHHLPLRHEKTCRNKLTLSSGTLMFRLKDKFSVFRNFFDQ